MYITSKRYFLGQTDQTTLAQKITRSTDIFSYTDAIYKLQENANNKDWVTMNSAVTNLLVDSNLLSSAGTLIEPLKILQNLINQTLKNVDTSADLKITLNKLAVLAQTEASASPEDRLINEELLTQRLYNLNSDVRSVTSTNIGIKAIWNKIIGKEKNLFEPLQNNLTNVISNLKNTPLTINGKANLTAQLTSLQQTIDAAIQNANTNLLLFAAPILLGIIGTTILSKTWAWSSTKAKEHAVKHITKLHKKYIKKEPESIGSAEKRRKRN